MLGEYTSMALLLPVSTLVGYGMGYGLDRLFGTHFLYIVFLILGTAAGFVEIIRQLLQDVRDDETS
ncbi:MAG: AtpZ/AtpI family protein [Acidobacteriia bacterium]|nr:AtpZ/AtpI family protein [Terriglobia bacterium]